MTTFLYLVFLGFKILAAIAIFIASVYCLCRVILWARFEYSMHFLLKYTRANTFDLDDQSSQEWERSLEGVYECFAKKLTEEGALIAHRGIRILQRLEADACLTGISRETLGKLIFFRERSGFYIRQAYAIQWDILIDVPDGYETDAETQKNIDQLIADWVYYKKALQCWKRVSLLPTIKVYTAPKPE